MPHHLNLLIPYMGGGWDFFLPIIVPSNIESLRNSSSPRNGMDLFNCFPSCCLKSIILDCFSVFLHLNFVVSTTILKVFSLFCYIIYYPYFIHGVNINAHLLLVILCDSFLSGLHIDKSHQWI